MSLLKKHEPHLCPLRVKREGKIFLLVLAQDKHIDKKKRSLLADKRAFPFLQGTKANNNHLNGTTKETDRPPFHSISKESGTPDDGEEEIMEKFLTCLLI